ncbi:MAG: methionine--tRNA ligase, partial [Christensenellales bacterium]
MQDKKFYITTPIYYLSGKPHLGTCSTTVYADAIARFKRLLGYDVMFLTGSDEHGQKVADKAEKQGITPKEFCDTLDVQFKELWKMLNISYDKYIRTTDDYHEKTVQKIFKKLYDKGDIYLSKYEGWYCTPCESFFTEAQLVDGKCPDCGREVKKAQEEAYFFKLSKYANRVKEYILSHPEFVKLESTKNEMLSFINQGLNDLCVSRTSVKWGVPVPFDTKHTVYVWIDALPNYISALGYASDDETLFKKFWPADVHLMAQEIARFHIIIWPAILMALDLPLPKTIHAHGWLTKAGEKMGKSLGNGFNPYVLCQRYGVDAVRYFLLKYGPILGDAPYDNESFVKAINTDLVNDIANLLSRTSAMMVQNFEGRLQPLGEILPIDKNLIDETIKMKDVVSDFVDKLEVNNALGEILRVVRLANKYIEDTAPWTLKQDKERLGTVLHNL